MHSYKHVLIDDLHLLSRSKQQLLYRLASEHIYATADKIIEATTEEKFPNEAFLQEFNEAFPLAKVKKLPTCFAPAEIAHLLNAIRQRQNSNVAPLVAAPEHEEGGQGCLLTHAERTMEEELRYVVQSIGQAHAEGTPLSSIALVGSNKEWLKAARTALKRCGIPLAKAESMQKNVPFREEAACAPCEKALIDRLHENPQDGLAWRTWCGIGDFMARSVAVEQLQSRFAKDGTSFCEALQTLNCSQTPEQPALDNLRNRYKLGLERISEACANSANTPGDATDKKRVIGQSHDGVYVGKPEGLEGKSFDLIIFSGFVNGFIPSRSFCDLGSLVGKGRQREELLCLQSIAKCAHSAKKQLLFTGFEQCSLEVAERLDLHIARIQIKDGKRVCKIEASEFLPLIEEATGSI